jgi:hypothetical protein
MIRAMYEIDHRVFVELIDVWNWLELMEWN